MRYSLQALVEASGLTEAALAREVGLSGSTLKKAREDGLTEPAADRYAVRAGLHPAEVWDDFGLVECATCDGLFAPSRAGHRHCTEPCRQNAYRRRRYHLDPEFAERRREQARAYYAEHGDVARAKQRRRDQARREAA